MKLVDYSISLILTALIGISTILFAQTQPNKETGAGSAAQQPAANPIAPAGPELQAGSLIYAELSKSIDAKKAKAGDPVMAKITQAVLSHGKVVIPKNTKIVGHLTSVKASSKQQRESQLGIAFDRAELKDGTQIPLTSVTIQAMAALPALEQQPANAANGGDGMGPGIGTGMPSTRPGSNMGGMGAPMGGSQYPSNTGGDTGDASVGTGTTSPAGGSARLNAGSRGVVGMSGVRLAPQAQGAVVSADGKNVKLDSGIQLVLRAQ